jgi:thiosulfate dehydrogenase [quinone] large subunit
MELMKFSKIQTIVLVLLRLVVGYHFLYEGMDKLFDLNWTSAGFLLQSNWLFADIFHSLVESSIILEVVDFMNIWGQILIGIGLILGLFSTWAAYAGALLIFFYYIAIPPFINSYTFIDKNLLELFAFLVLAVFPTSQIIGIDLLINKFKKGIHDKK